MRKLGWNFAASFASKRAVRNSCTDSTVTVLMPRATHENSCSVKGCINDLGIFTSVLTNGVRISVSVFMPQVYQTTA